MEAIREPSSKPVHGNRLLRAAGLGLITGAADDDPSAIGTYASAGATFGPSFLWTAPVMFPMMFAVVYLSAKLGQVSGQGLFGVIRKNYSRWILYPTLAGVLIGNTIEAGADLGGIAAALNLLIPVPVGALVPATALIILVLQIWGSYSMIKKVFRVLGLTLLAYVPAALLAKPQLMTVLRGTLIPYVHFDKEFLSMLVAVIGATLSAYLCMWQSNQEVEEEKAMGRVSVAQRRGASEEELRNSRTDVLSGMFFSSLVMYFILLAATATLFKAGKTNIGSAADAARALRPLAGNAAGILFSLGIVGGGFLAVPVMTAGGAYSLCQTAGWSHGLNKRPAKAKRFYLAITALTLAGAGLNFLGFNPMRALVIAGIVQGFSTPPLMLLVMLMTNNRKIMGERTNGRGINALGWVTVAAIFAATIGLVISWLV